MTDLSPGTHRSLRASVHLGRQEIPFESLELEVTPSDTGDLQVYGAGRIRAKLPGLSPGSTGIDIRLEIEGKQYRIADATVFDVDVHASGETVIQVTGKVQLFEGEDEGSF
jgi:hypothetical protein